MKIRPLQATRRGKVDVDLFAGGGGASDGKRRATGTSPDVAVNHWRTAIGMHKVNHQDCVHLCEDVVKVRPLKATRGRLVRFLWASPTCSFFSRASGQRLSPDTLKIRGLAWMIMPWIIQTRPDVILIENVIEFMKWGPVCWQHHDRCRGENDGKACLDVCNYGRPIKSRAGETFRAWMARIESFGYSVEVRTLKAWEYGSPTMRERVYIACCANGKAFAWPQPTHVVPELADKTGLKPWRTAAEIIDWSIPCPSIFDRARPHVPATRRRIVKGMAKYVLEAQKPFLMHLTHGDRHAPHSVDEPVPTVTGANRGEQSLVVPYMVHRSNGERPGQTPRTYDVRAPYPTVVGGGVKTSPVAVFLAKSYSERSTGGWNGGASVNKPIDVITAQDHHHLVAAHTVKFYGTSTGHSLNEPVHTVTGGGWKHGIVAASLLRYNGERRAGESSRGQTLEAPMSTLDASNRFALLEATMAAAPEWTDAIASKARRVYLFMKREGYDGPGMDHEHKLVRIPGTELVVYDIGMRMLVPRELFRANGFADSYVIDFVKPDGKRVTKTEQVRLVGNSVCPDVAEALVRAALAMLPRPRRRPANDERQVELELMAA
jgi:DNA (cytosine-5)-methyltransferase 1